MKYLYLNGKKSVAIEYNETSEKEETEEKTVKNVNINGAIHDFKDEEKPDKLAYAIDRDIPVLLENEARHISFDNETAERES